MNANSGPSSDKPGAARDDSDKRTPAADVQPEDAGTEASAEPDARSTSGGTTAESAMKQESKTDAERRR